MPSYITRVHRFTTANRPWNAPRANSEPYVPIHHPDAQETIDKCLECPLPPESCNGNGECYTLSMDNRKLTTKRKKKPAGQFNYERFMAAINSGKSINRIALEFNVTHQTVCVWKKKYLEWKR